MTNMSSLVVLFMLGLCSMCSGFLVNSTDPKLLLYFDKVVVSVKAPSGAESRFHKLEFNSNNTVVHYSVVKNATAVDKEKSMVIQMDFKRSAGTPEISVDTLAMNWSVISTGRSYYEVKLIEATIKGTTQGNAFGGDKLRLLSAIKLEAPLLSSFHCGKFGALYPAFMNEKDDTSSNSSRPSIEFVGLRMQAFSFSPKEPERFSNQAWDCVGFFSAGIWSGIFILAILIGVVTWGIYMIMDVKTMDRFDDPKGKPISFGGAE